MQHLLKTLFCSSFMDIQPSNVYNIIFWIVYTKIAMKPDLFFIWKKYEI